MTVLAAGIEREEVVTGYEPVFICAGRGKRLRLGEGDQPPKCLVPVAGTPILGRLMRRFVRPGIRAIFVHAAGSDDVPRYVRSSGVQNAVFVTQDHPDGVANAVHLALPYLGRDALVVLGDVVLRGSFRSPLPALPAVGVWSSGSAEATSAGYGVAVGPGGVTRLIEKPRAPKGLECGMGVYLLTAEVIDRFQEAPVDLSTGERDITTAIDFAVRAVGRHLSVLRFDGTYVNVNTPADLRLASNALESAGRHGDRAT